MSYWNQGYNRKKQLGIQPNQYNKTIKAPHHNIFVMTIISIVGIYALYWAATL